MEFAFFKTTEIDNSLLDSFVKNFNITYNREINKNTFLDYYLNSILGYSFHVYMIEGDEVVGACAVVPYEYVIDNRTVIFGLSVGLFVRDDFRKDMLNVSKITNIFRKKLVENNVEAIIAVNNDNAYNYYKRVCKWKDIGNLNYYILPLNLGNVLKKWHLLNPVSNLFFHTYTKFSSIFSTNKSQKKYSIYLNPENLDLNEKQKYGLNYKHIEVEFGKFTYKIYDENGIITAYIIDFYDRIKFKNPLILAYATKYIAENEKVDIIIFIGQLAFKQFSLFKCPKTLEPRALHFTCDNLSLNEQENNLLINLANWDFSLFNYDVR